MSTDNTYKQFDITTLTWIPRERVLYGVETYLFRIPDSLLVVGHTRTVFFQYNAELSKKAQRGLFWVPEKIDLNKDVADIKLIFYRQNKDVPAEYRS